MDIEFKNLFKNIILFTRMQFMKKNLNKKKLFLESEAKRKKKFRDKNVIYKQYLNK